MNVLKSEIIIDGLVCEIVQEESLKLFRTATGETIRLDERELSYIVGLCILHGWKFCQPRTLGKDV